MVRQPLETSLREVQLLKAAELADRAGHAAGDVSDGVVGEEEPLQEWEVLEGVAVEVVQLVVAQVHLLHRDGRRVRVIVQACGGWWRGQWLGAVVFLNRGSVVEG